MTVSDTLKSVLVVTDDELEVNGGRYTLQQGPAIKVRGYIASTIGSRKVKGGDAQPIYVLTENDIRANGGRWRVTAGQAIQVTDVIGDTRGIIQGTAIPVFPVDDQGNFDPNFGFIPTNISGLILWVAGDLGLSLSDGDPVATWPDQSGNGNDANQAAAAKRPIFRTNILNSRPIVRFDGANDRLIVTSNAGLKLEDGVTIFIVCQRAVSGAFMSVAGKPGTGISANENYAMWFVAGNMATFYIGDGAGFQAASTAAIAQDVWVILTGWCDESDTKIYLDGDLKMTNPIDVVMNADDNDFHIGADIAEGNRFTGDIAEIILYNTELSNVNLERVETYLGQKWGITIS